MPFTFASSTIDMKFSAIMPSVAGPVSLARSLVPAWMTTTFGFRADHVLAEADQHLRRWSAWRCRD